MLFSKGHLSAWVISFTTWAILESSIRILLDHPYWNLLKALDFTLWNLAFYLAWSLLLGIPHAILLSKTASDKIKNKWLRQCILPEWVTAIYAILTPMILIESSFLMRRFTSSIVLSWAFGILIIIIIYIDLIILRPLIERVKQKLSSLKYFFIIGVNIISLCVILAIPLKNFNQQQTIKKLSGPIKYVILISIDTLRYDYVSCYGFPNAQTPIIDNIAQEGVRFENAFSLIPLTGPSHSSMLTGFSPIIHGVTINNIPLPNKIKTITEHLHSAGFRTGGFVSGYPLKALHCRLDKGFDFYDDRFCFNDRFNETYYGKILGETFFRYSGMERTAKRVTDSALEWLHKDYKSPFFIFLHYFDPHYPYGDISKIFQERADISDLPNQKRLYAKDITMVDSEIGRFIDFLKHHGIYNEALIIITADHGESFGEHNYYYDHPEYLYDQLVRIPLIIRCPLLIKPEFVYVDQVSLIDIYRTIASSVGFTPRQEIGGYDLIQMIRPEPNPSNRIIMAHTFAPEAKCNRHMVRTPEWKLIRNDEKSGPVYELYNLIDDPGEKINHIELNREKAHELEHRMKQLNLIR